MRNFKEYIAENAVVAGDVENHAIAAAEKLTAQLKQVLGSRYVAKAHYSHNLGKSIHLRVVDTNPANGIAHNSPVFSQFIMYLSTNYGKDTDLPKVSWEMSQGPRSVPFRKITSAKSIDDATNKLIDWFKKNKPALDSLLK